MLITSRVFDSTEHVAPHVGHAACCSQLASTSRAARSCVCPAEISAEIHSHTLDDAVMRRLKKQSFLDLFLDGELSKLPQKILLFFLPRRSIGIHA
jgi:hypothetical protein